MALGDTDECAEGAKVTLIKGPKETIDETTTNNYGDFKFDNLEENSGNYSLEIEYPGYKKQTLEIDLKTSINMGTVFL